MASYTGVLVDATVIPVWNRHIGSLPIHCRSGLNSAVSILELAVGHEDDSALNTLGLAEALMKRLKAQSLSLLAIVSIRLCNVAKAG